MILPMETPHRIPTSMQEAEEAGEDRVTFVVWAEENPRADSEDMLEKYKRFINP